MNLGDKVILLVQYWSYLNLCGKGKPHIGINLELIL